MTDDESSTDAVAHLLGDFGSEEHLAAHITARRKALGWSQDRLAEEMARVGVPVPQSAISKIEKPATGGRRAITVDEALGFSKVFGVPLDELLLPDGAAEQLEVMRMLRHGPGLRLEAMHGYWAYTSLVERIAKWARLSVSNLADVTRLVNPGGSDASPDEASSLDAENRHDFYMDVFNSSMLPDFQVRIDPPGVDQEEALWEQYEHELEMRKKGYYR